YHTVLVLISSICDSPHRYKPNHEDRPSYNGTVPRLSSSIDLKLRFLNPDDLDEVKILCQDWFPVEYPESWYRDITSNPRFYSLAAVLEHRIIGLVVAEIKDQTYLNKEDRDILAISQQRGCKIAYILSLGVSRQHRRNGVASLLLDNLLMHLTTEENKCVKAVLLHVLTSNASAIRFYENRCIPFFPTTTQLKEPFEMDSLMCCTSMEAIHHGDYYILCYTYLLTYLLYLFAQCAFNASSSTQMLN
ncbi:unnamed protein product, partial [Darwinula stevensoni]